MRAMHAQHSSVKKNSKSQSQERDSVLALNQTPEPGLTWLPVELVRDRRFVSGLMAAIRDT
jgi:hypothetical protein